jgi:hypothetical protein
MRTILCVAAISAAMVLASCSTSRTSAPELEQNLTYDGLAKVKDAKVSSAWMRPDFTLAGYTKIMLQGAGIEYRPVKPVNRMARSSGTQFPVTPEQQARLRTIVSDAFRNELAQSKRFQLVEEPGPDVLTIWGGLVDVVSFVPPDPIGRGNIYLSSVGEATLVIEIRDSESNSVLVRVVDRRAADMNQAGGVARQSNSVTNWSEVQQLARSWASRLRTSLDEAATWQ